MTGVQREADPVEVLAPGPVHPVAAATRLDGHLGQCQRFPRGQEDRQDATASSVGQSREQVVTAALHGRLSRLVSNVS